MRKGRLVAIGTLAGIAIGATAGILFAPGKGARTRKQIKDRGDEYMNEMKLKFDELHDSLSGKFNSTKREAKYLAKKGKAKYQDAKKEVRNVATDFNHSK